MESPFEYSRYVTGTSFIGRTRETALLCSLIKERNHVLLYGPPKTGKKSLVYNAFYRLKQESYPYVRCTLNLFNIRSTEEMLLKYANEAAALFTSSAEDRERIRKKYLPSVPYIIDGRSSDQPRFAPASEDPLSPEQVAELLMLPQRLAEENGSHLLIYIERFHDILLFEDPDSILSEMEKAWNTHRHVTYIITGERTNNMHEIFHEKKYFYGFAQQIPLAPIEERVFTEYIIKGFLKAGKVVKPELATQIYTLMEGHPWYIQRLSALCFERTRGYLTDAILEQSLECLINMHYSLYHYFAFLLSRHQLRFIQAITDGHTRLSTAEIIEEYNLNSSANVNRLKTALAKKEIITFNERKEIIFLDPLLKLWFKTYFFVK